VRALLLALIVPPIAATIVVGAAATGSPAPPRNIAEAAAMASAVDVLRMLRDGEDPARQWQVRPEIISSAVTRVTALEAAIWSRQQALVELMDREGAIRDNGARTHMACLAADLRADDIVNYLTRDGAPACVAGETLAAVMVRSRTP
jgi:hypothetical protein